MIVPLAYGYSPPCIFTKLYPRGRCIHLLPVSRIDDIQSLQFDHQHVPCYHALLLLEAYAETDIKSKLATSEGCEYLLRRLLHTWVVSCECLADNKCLISITGSPDVCFILYPFGDQLFPKTTHIFHMELYIWPSFLLVQNSAMPRCCKDRPWRWIEMALPK